MLAPPLVALHIRYGQINYKFEHKFVKLAKRKRESLYYNNTFITNSCLRELPHSDQKILGTHTKFIQSLIVIRNNKFSF